jgi:hypothetical protein
MTTTGQPASEREVITLGIAIAERLDGMLAGARYKSADQAQHCARICLTIAEVFNGVLALLESPAQTHAPVLARTMVEALVDLKNLVADPDYLDQLRFDNADQQLKTFAGFRDDPDVGLDEEERRGLDRWIAIEQEIYNRTYTPERKACSVYKKFERAGMLDTYQTAYRFLCSFSHNDLNTLRARHGGGARLRFRQPLPPETLAKILGLAANLYAGAIRTAPSFSTISEDTASASADWVTAVTVGLAGD